MTFRLVKPDPDFLYALALPFAFAVPAGTPDAPAGATPIPATGPYLIQRYTEGKEVVLARNPEFSEWSEAAQPDGFPDRLVWRLGRNLDQMVAEILEGDADLMLPPPLPPRIAELASSHAGQVHLVPTAQTYYMSLNTQIPPFDDPKVRRALNFAVDRRAIEEMFGGSARTTCQVLPPNFPGYAPYCPYTRHPDGTWTAPDPAMAKRLVDESGTAGSRVTVWATPDSYLGLPVPVGRYFVDVLHEFGYRATLKVVAGQRYFPAIYDPSGHVQMAFIAWTTDYPAESGFIVPTLTCDSTTNDTHFCDRGIDMRMDEAARLLITDPPTAHELWSSIEHDIVDLAPWVPLANRSWVNLVSERLGNFQLHPQWGPLVDQMWVR